MLPSLKRLFCGHVSGCLILAAAAGFPIAAQAQDAGQPQAPAAQPDAAQPEDAQPQATAPEVDPQTRELIDRVTGFYKNLQTVKVTATMAVEMQGQDPASPMTLTMAAERPNKFAVPAGEGNQDYRFVSDGEHLYQYISEPLNKYSQEPAPANFEGLAASGMFASAGMGSDLSSLATAPHMIMMHLLQGKPLTDIGGLTRIETVGSEDLDGQPHHHVRLVGEEADVDMWFASGETPWLKQVRPDMTKTFEQFGDMGEHLKDSMPKVTLTFAQWEKDPELPDTTFAFVPPDGAEKVDSLMDALRDAMGGGGDGEEGRAHAQLLGKPAPEVNVDLLEGGKADLAKHKDQVVVLDFWATWCGPCIRALPILSKVTEQYKDKGVVFYAVNVNEDAETVRTFLEKRKFALRVPMDTDGSVSERYGVSGIPQTVLIGKDGTVQAIHVGFSPNLEQQLTEELDTLVKGEKLHKE